MVRQTLLCVSFLLAAGCDSATPTIAAGARDIPYRVLGTGGPSVIFLTDWNSAAEDWYGVQDKVSQLTASLLYDRTAAAADDLQPRTPGHVIAELEQVMSSVDLPRPYVVVGHGAGALYARLFAAKHETDVAGLVLINALHEDLDAAMAAIMPKEAFAEYSAARDKTFSTRGARGEYAYLKEAYAQVHELPPLPERAHLTIISGGTPALVPYVPEDRLDAWKVFYELQGRLGSLALNSRWLVARQSGHAIHQDQPEVIVDAIDQMVNLVRQPEDSSAASEKPFEQIEFQSIDDLLSFEE
ncbi:MAG: alpha/beta hydrolase [Candidatus Hydrogenedentes bacterium]|nr:alpha/beta hydrolase [Candidatus Hydrogenedentota bacterium]